VAPLSEGGDGWTWVGVLEGPVGGGRSGAEKEHTGAEPLTVKTKCTVHYMSGAVRNTTEATVCFHYKSRKMNIV